MLNNKLTKWSKYFIWFRFITLILACFSPFNHPHIIRQVDTMGVSLRYWLRWVIEPNLSYSLLPAVLNSGDSYGISTMEFPFLNILLAPLFSLPIDLARPLARFVLLVICCLLSLYHYKIWKKNAEESKDNNLSHFTLAALIIPIFSITGLYLGKFMPDYLAFIFVSVAIGLGWRNKKYFICFLFSTLGLLIKPPVVVAFAVIFLKKELRSILKDSVWVVPSIVVALLYYTKGLDYIRLVSDMAPYFYTELRPPIESLILFLKEPLKLFKVINEDIFTKFLWVLLFPFTVWVVKKYRDFDFVKLWILFLLQVLAVGVLDGEHAFIHDYYFIGTSFVAALILSKSLKYMGPKLVWVPLVLIAVSFLERSFYATKKIRTYKDQNEYQCNQLIQENKQVPWRSGYKFRSSIESYPELGVCFGEIQNSKESEYGFYLKEKIDSLPKGCVIVDETKNIILTQCKSN